jgi:hypothetical protein
MPVAGIDYMSNVIAVLTGSTLNPVSRGPLAGTTGHLKFVL